ncbi:MBL fold metallo-hydrolase [Caldisericum sp. AR60]|uniref:MBL fold metallo-hydrolase n=1 Tax=Caldisericum sp. AR60 TaxID=3397852 RepID=UPI0039FCA241
MELKEIKEQIFYIEDTTNIGLVELGNEFLLIDAGIDKDKGKKIKKILEEKGIKPKYLILTHHHADHTGGARFLKDYFGITAISSKLEKIFIENPILEPIYLSLGSSPNKNFLSKWIRSSEVEIDVEAENLNQDSFKNLKILNLSGHSIGMIGISLENVVFSSDAFFSKEVLEKYIIPYFHDLEQFENSMKSLISMDYEYILPSHGVLYTKSEGDKIIKHNLKHVEEIKDNILDMISVPRTVEEIFKELQITLHDPVVYTLIESSIRAILNYFINRDEANQFVEKEKLLYKRK